MFVGLRNPCSLDVGRAWRKDLNSSRPYRLLNNIGPTPIKHDKDLIGLLVIVNKVVLSSISGKISYCNNLHFRFPIINFLFYCKLYLISVDLGLYIYLISHLDMFAKIAYKQNINIKLGPSLYI